MKEITIDNVIFKVKDYLPYSDLNSLNLYGLSVVQAKLIKYKKNIPEIKDVIDFDENNKEEAYLISKQKEFLEVLQEKIGKGEIIIPDEVFEELNKAQRQLIEFENNITRLLLVSPTFDASRPSVIKKLKQDPQYKQVIKNVSEDIEAIMDPEGQSTNQSKKD
jgi:hypothetical protein